MKGLMELTGVSAGYLTRGYSDRTMRGRSALRDIKPALRDIDLSVGEGELLVLAGPNGSGKTTLLKTACGLLPPLEGSVTINGKSLNAMKSRERAAHTAFLFQIRDNPWPFTVRETISQGRFARCGWLGAQTKEDREAVNTALEKADLVSLAERPITELSGGELQRVYIARSIAQGAAFLLLDEPENNLDPKYAYMIMSLIETLVKEGRSAIVSLHDLRLASRFAQRIALLSLGTISSICTPEEILNEKTLAQVFDLAPELIRSLVL